MLYLGGLEKSPEAGTLRAGEALAQGRALGRMARLIEFQGGDPNVVEDPLLIPQAPEVKVLTAHTSGFVSGISPVALGHGVVELGGGRRRLGDSVDLRVGFLMEVRLGDRVEAGDPLGEVHAADTYGIEKGLGILENAVTLDPAPPRLPSSLILERVQGSE
jgi:thymidine phosphorylase